MIIQIPGAHQVETPENYLIETPHGLDVSSAFEEAAQVVEEAALKVAQGSFPTMAEAMDALFAERGWKAVYWLTSDVDWMEVESKTMEEEG